ncbi:hypothetical protein EON80_08280 [bacterium]|nr:MAG: hypothetical protein EON80_08280 [bacterium]
MPEHLNHEEYCRRVLEAANRGAQIAIETHRRMGQSVVVWEDGKIKRIPASDIEPQNLEALKSR